MFTGTTAAPEGAPGRKTVGKMAGPGSKERLTATAPKPPWMREVAKDFGKYKYLYLMAVPVLAYYLIFAYWPMYGAQIAFKEFSPGLGITGSPWVGLQHYRNFFGSFYFWRILRNTVVLNILGLFITFPAPILLALLLNELRGVLFRRVVQTVSYLPHFISIMVVCGMIVDFTRSGGVINDAVVALGGKSTTMLLRPEMFRTIYIASDIWQSIGWSSIIYLAALAAVDPQLYEAAGMDGASRLMKILHVSLPGILPTVVVLLILRVGQIMSVGYEKIILLYNPANYETADVISSFVYRKGLMEFNFSYSTAVGLFNSFVNLAFLGLANKLSRTFTENSLW
jgi:putative aldouronate transport system permease protein